MSIARRINSERLVVLGWSRAILMQIAHPLVAAGVADHSSFRAGGGAALTRLHHTIRAMRRLSFGDEAARVETLDRIRAIHRRVNGRLSVSVGPFAAGTPYSAEDPELVLWVHATLLDSLARIYDSVVERVSDDERDSFCAEAAQIAVLLGARDADVPRTWSALQHFLTSMSESGAIVVGGQALAVAQVVLRPRLTPLARPAVALNRLITIGTLPDTLRRAYQMPWTERDARRLRRAIRLIRHTRRALPDSLATWPDARVLTASTRPVPR